MKTRFLSTFLFLGVASHIAAQDTETIGLHLPTTLTSRALAAAAFDPHERISLDLKDAKLTDVLATLGALANLPTVIDPEIQGTVTVQLQDVELGTVLEILSRQNGVSIRVEAGRLVASLPEKRPLHSRAIPDEFRDSARLPLEQYSGRFGALGRITIRTRLKGSERCVGWEVKEDEQAVVPLSSGPEVAPLALTPFGFDPVSGWRYIAGQSGEFSFALVVDRSGRPFSIEDDRPIPFRITLSEGAAPDCPAAETHKISPLRSAVSVSLEVAERGSGGEIVTSPRIQLQPGSVGAVSSDLPADDRNPERTLKVCVYAFPDGRHIAGTLVATSIFKDPIDGRDYVYSQPGTVRVPPPMIGEKATLSILSAGVAASKPLELRMVPEEKPGAGNR